VPPRLKARSVLGDCQLELQDAVLTSHVTVIEAKATLGAVTIFVPDRIEDAAEIGRIA
jgi:predicted membrane protein